MDPRVQLLDTNRLTEKEKIELASQITGMPLGTRYDAMEALLQKYAWGRPLLKARVHDIVDLAVRKALTLTGDLTVWTRGPMFIFNPSALPEIASGASFVTSDGEFPPPTFPNLEWWARFFTITRTQYNGDIVRAAALIPNVIFLEKAGRYAIYQFPDPKARSLYDPATGPITIRSSLGRRPGDLFEVTVSSIFHHWYR